MPYIQKDERANYDTTTLNGLAPVNASGLNYVFTKIIWNYLRRHDMNYQAINDIIGALEGAKLEAYRRHFAEYEDKKLNENGDVT